MLDNMRNAFISGGEWETADIEPIIQSPGCALMRKDVRLVVVEVVNQVGVCKSRQFDQIPNVGICCALNDDGRVRRMVRTGRSVVESK